MKGQAVAEESDILSQIESEVIDQSKSVSSALLKCLTLGGYAKSAELRTWAAHELRGYPGVGDLPEYRKIGTPLLMDAFTSGGLYKAKTVSVIDLPREARKDIGDELPLTYGVEKIEALIQQADSQGKVNLAPPAAAELALMMTHEVGRYQVERVYWSVGSAVLRGVLAGVRVTLAELVAELRAGTRPGDLLPSPEITSRAVQFAVYGKGNRVTVNTAISTSGDSTVIARTEAAPAVQPGFWTFSRKVWAAVVGLATVVGAIAAVWALQTPTH